MSDVERLRMLITVTGVMLSPLEMSQILDMSDDRVSRAMDQLHFTWQLTQRAHYDVRERSEDEAL